MQIFDLPEPTLRLAAIGFSPDGRLIAGVERGRVFVLDTTVGTVRTLWAERDPGGASDAGVGFTADGRGVLAHHNFYPRAAVEVHHVETGAVVRDFAMNNYERCEPGPGGRFVYVAAKPSPGRAIVEIVRWNPLTGEKLPAFGRHAYTIQKLAVSRDEKWVAGSAGETIRLWNLGGKKPPSRASRQITIPNALVVSLALSADGAYLAAGTFLSQTGGAHVADVQTGTTHEVARPERNTGHDVAFHPSRPLLACRGQPGEVVFWDAATHAEVNRFAWPVGELAAIAFSPDGLRCAASGTGKVVVWDVDG